MSCCEPESSALPPAVSADESARRRRLAELNKALGHPIRVEIVAILRRHETCLCGDIVELLPLAQSTVSQHLKVLKAAGIVQGEIDGPRTCYCLDPAVLDEYRSLAADL